MISPAYVRTMARYNVWQNRSIYTAAAGLSDAARKQDRGAFFGSIHATLNHLLWGDRTWLARLAGQPKPLPGSIAESTAYFDAFDVLRAERLATDEAISAWADTIDHDWLARDLTYLSAAAGRQISHPHWVYVVHVFNHQTHHRGQVHAMLTAAGARPEATDLPFMPE